MLANMAVPYVPLHVLPMVDPCIFPSQQFQRFSHSRVACCWSIVVLLDQSQAQLSFRHIELFEVVKEASLDGVFGQGDFGVAALAGIHCGNDFSGQGVVLICSSHQLLEVSSRISFSFSFSTSLSEDVGCQIKVFGLQYHLILIF